VLVGGGAGQINGEPGGRPIRFKDQTPMANVLLTLLEKVGVHRERFGDSTGKIPELLSR
jgi:hypothetical protein